MLRSNVSERVAGPVGGTILFAALAIVLAGCEETLEVEDREFLTPQAVSTDLLVAGAIRDFNTAYSGGGLTDRFLSVTALISDELHDVETFTTRIATDQRAQQAIAQGNTSDATYTNLHRARRAALRAFEGLTEDGRANAPEAAEMKMLEGYTYVALGEGFCSGIPFSELEEDGTLDIENAGVPLATQDVFQEAIVRFDAAVGIDGGQDAARVGKARALVNLGRYDEAAAAVAAVPTSFLRVIGHSDNTGDQENPIFNLQSNGRYSLSDREGVNGLPFRSAGDPRIPWVEAGVGFDDINPLFLSQKYSESRSAPVVLADGIEARLIEAEAALNAGNAGTFVQILNGLRADVANLMAARIPDYSSLVPGPNNPTTTLPPLSDPGSDAARQDLLFSERAFWMWGTGHRLGDLRRLINQYGRQANDVYPTGAYHKGGTYGNDVVLPLDFREQNNPNWDVNLCSVTTP